MSDPFGVFDELPSPPEPGRSPGSHDDGGRLGISRATMATLELRVGETSELWPSRKPSRSGVVFRHGAGELLAYGPGHYEVGTPLNAYNVLPGGDGGQVDLYFCPVEAARAWPGTGGQVAWVRGAGGWRDDHDRPLATMLAHLEGRPCVLRCDGRLDDLDQWRQLKALHEAVLAVASLVEVVVGGATLMNPFATAPKSAPHRAREAVPALRGNEAASRVPGPVLVARAITADPGWRGYLGPRGAFYLEVAATDFVRCFDGNIRRGPDGLWVYSRGLWAPAGDVGSMVLAALLRDAWSQATEDKILGFLGRKPEHGPLSNHPQDDNWSGVVNFRNGLFDWPTGVLSSHDPAVLSTWQLTVPYEVGDAPGWLHFLGEVLPPDMLEPDENGVAPWQEDLGYLLLPGNPFHMSFLLRGGGRNGKGVWMTVVQLIAGRHSSVSLEDISSPERSRFRTFNLYGSPLNVCGEIDPKYMRDTAAFKALTGDHPLQFEAKFRRPFTARAWATLLFSANTDFRTSDNSVAFWDRWQVRAFPNYISEDRRDRHLPRKLYDKEGPQIAALAMAGLSNLMARGRFVETPSSAEAKRRWRRHSDHVGRFIEERCSFGPEQCTTTRQQLLEAYKQWCDDEQERFPVRAAELYAAVRTAAVVAGVPEEHVERKVHGTRGFGHLTLEEQP